MKKTLVAIILLYCSFASVAQDRIITASQDTIVCKVWETTPRYIAYVLWENQTGPIHKLDVRNVSQVIYKGGEVEAYSARNMEEPPDGIVFRSKDSKYAIGYQDAERYYKGYRAAGTVALLGGLIPSLIMSSVKPNPRSFVIPDRKMWEDAEYRRGYMDSAKEIKKDKVWTNFAWGMLINFGFYLVMLVAIASAY